MNQQLRNIGITMGLTGTGIMEKMIRKEIKTTELSDEQVKYVLEAWDTRNYVPANYIGNVDIVKPVITKEEVANGYYTQKEYDRNYVEMIEKFLHTLV